MMSETWSLKKSMELIKLKTDKLIDGKEGGFFLKDDVWGKETLILRSGMYLTEEIITKLMNFGVKKVNVDFDDLIVEEPDKEEQQKLLKHFTATQSVLIVEKNLINASTLVRQLVSNGFKEGNIFVTNNPNTINRYFRAKQINFLFIDEELYEICEKCVEKYSLLRNTHTFIIVNALNLSEIKKVRISRIKFLQKSCSEEKSNNLILEALNQNFLDFCDEEKTLIS